MSKHQVSVQSIDFHLEYQIENNLIRRWKNSICLDEFGNSINNKHKKNFIANKTIFYNKTWSSVSNSSFIFVLDFKFWLVLVEGNKVKSLSKLKNAIKTQDLLLNEKFHLF